MTMQKTAYENGMRNILELFKLAAPNVAALRAMMKAPAAATISPALQAERSVARQMAGEVAAANPFRPIGKGAVPNVDRHTIMSKNPFAAGVAQARPVPGFASGNLQSIHGLEQLGGTLSPHAVATGALSKPIAAAAPPAQSNALRERLLKTVRG